MSQGCNFIKKDTLGQRFSCEFCEISKNTFFYRTALLAAFNYKRFKRIIKFRNYFLPENLSLRCWFSGEAVHGCFSKMVLLKISEYSQENTCAGPCRPSFTEHLSWLLQHFRGSKFFFQVNLVSIADCHTGFYAELLWKHDLNLRGSHWNSSVKTVFLEISQISQKNTCVEVSF